MELFRSEEMQLMQLMIPAEAAHDTMVAIGEMGMLQFKDLNADRSAFQRTFASQIKRCDEMTRQIRFLTEEVDKAGLPRGARVGERELELDELESRLSRLENEVLELNLNTERINRSYNELLELQLVLETAGTFFEEARSSAGLSTRESLGSDARIGEGGDASSDIGAPLLESAAPPPEPKAVHLGSVAGTIPVDKLGSFERLLFRATRGNMFLRSTSVGAVADPASGDRQEKAVFVVFYAGERARQKIVKICEAFNANKYPLPEDVNRQREMSADVNARLRELHSTLDAGTRLQEAALRGAAAEIDAWAVRVRREKAVFHTLNKFSVDVSRKVLMGEAWVPASMRLRVQDALQAAAARAAALSGVVFQPLITYEPPPTYFSTGKITSAFQEIVDAYGIARYREANPAVFTIITFPFLFAVMFGDVGHGFMMLLFALWMVLSEKKLAGKNLGDILGMLFGGRYVILLMAVFSIYVGLIYNEFFSIVTTIFGSSRYACATDASITDPEQIKADPSICPSAFNNGLQMLSPGSPYPFGVDPAWHGTRTELPFLNSMKMKMSIVLGVIQMNLGVVLSYFNQKHFGDSLSTICEFIPQMIFLNSLFGYLSILIVAKWASGGVADLYHTMIYMFLTPGDVDCSGECPENQMFAGQGFVQILLLLAALVAVPWMLFPKPYILKKRNEERTRSLSYGLLQENEDVESNPRNGGGDGVAVAHGHEAEFEFGEVIVHQMIHTIEFVLGAVSNTASYLRLWALSLAHSQLSAVFYDRVLMAGVQSGSVIGLVIAFAVFAGATLGVLLVMESLSAYLHALRLHWVEFQNKFFQGTGYKFAPFSFAVLDSAE